VLRISAVIPCYNGADYLLQALASVASQSRPPDEVIVVDDGSTDGSAAIAESWGATVLCQPNRGDGAARNTGLRAAGGDAVAWLDADDRWRPHHLEVVVGLLDRHPEAAVAFGAVERFGDDDTLIPGYVPTDAAGPVVREAFADWVHTTISAVVRRSALLDVGGFDESERYSVDFDLWLRLSRGRRFIATHEVTADWRWHPYQQSASRHRQIAAVYRYRRRFIDQLRRDGDEDLAVELEQDFARIWIRDVREAVGVGDKMMLRTLREGSPLVHELGTTDRRRWMVAAYAPSTARRAAAVRRALRGAVPRGA
jgi:glycosyltransferase involved in cell wall biosynthesis